MPHTELRAQWFSQWPDAFLVLTTLEIKNLFGGPIYARRSFRSLCRNWLEGNSDASKEITAGYVAAIAGEHSDNYEIVERIEKITLSARMDWNHRREAYRSYRLLQAIWESNTPFHTEIRDSLPDRSAWVIYADWLEERGAFEARLWREAARFT